MFVIDASVVVKWFIEEDDSPLALQLKQDHIKGVTTLLAPTLLLYEVANVLLFSRLFSSVEIKKSIHDHYNLEIDFINPSPDLTSPAIELAFSRKITLYDASYLAIARAFDIKLVTADRKLYSSAKDLNCIKLLS